MVKPLYTVTLQKTGFNCEPTVCFGGKKDLNILDMGWIKYFFDCFCKKNPNVLKIEFCVFTNTKIDKYVDLKYRVNWLNKRHAVWTDWIDYKTYVWPLHCEQYVLYECMYQILFRVESGIATNNGKSLQKSLRNALKDMMRHLAGYTR